MCTSGYRVVDVESDRRVIISNGYGNFPYYHPFGCRLRFSNPSGLAVRYELVLDDHWMTYNHSIYSDFKPPLQQYNYIVSSYTTFTIDVDSMSYRIQRSRFYARFTGKIMACNNT